MWDDVIIGKGDKGCTAVHVFDIEGDHSISHNNVSYWINDLLLGVGMTIFKNTKEGQKLTTMIENKTPAHKIINHLNGVMLRHINPDLLHNKIIRENKRCFEAGKRSKEMEIRVVLGLLE